MFEYRNFKICCDFFLRRCITTRGRCYLICCNICGDVVVISENVLFCVVGKRASCVFAQKKLKFFFLKVCPTFRANDFKLYSYKIFYTFLYVVYNFIIITNILQSIPQNPNYPTHLDPISLYLLSMD